MEGIANCGQQLIKCMYVLTEYEAALRMNALTALYYLVPCINAVRASSFQLDLNLHISSILAVTSPHHHPDCQKQSAVMAEEVKIDKQVFQDRLSQFLSAWKSDKRSNDALFGGVGSIVIRMGKNEQTITFQKNNAIHVSYDLPKFFI